jgi:Calx-beta domain-containing protein
MSLAKRAVWQHVLAFVAAVAVLCAPAFGSESITYSYDALGRLVRVDHCGTINNGTSASYAYDRADNRSNVAVGTSAPAAAPSFSVSDASATEGGALVFTVTMTGATSTCYTVNYATANNSAVAPGDYVGSSGIVAFAPSSGTETQTVAVATVDDSTIESTETMLLNLSAPSAGGTISDAQGIGSIIDNDSVCQGVNFTIASNGAVTEGASSAFTVTKHGTATGSCNVSYATANGTAIAPGDYTAKSGTLTFTSAQTAQTVSVTTIDDAVVENAETFTASLSSPTAGATLGTPSSATATISDNDGNIPPVANLDRASTTICQTIFINPVANDTDPDGDLPLSMVSVSGGQFTLLSSTEVEFDAPHTAGGYTGTYVVQDSRGAQSTGTMSVAVGSGSCTIGGGGGGIGFNSTAGTTQPADSTATSPPTDSTSNTSPPPDPGTSTTPGGEE